jgi:hypothetical protein
VATTRNTSTTHNGSLPAALELGRLSGPPRLGSGQ